MKILFQTIGIITIALSLNGCKGGTEQASTNAHNSKNSLDWAGMYRGISKTDEGKEEVYFLTLNQDSKFAMQSLVKGEENPIEHSGTFTWNKTGNEITLHSPNTNFKRTLTVGENTLIDNGDKFSMRKIHNEGITEKYWKLIEINGKPLSKDEKLNREPHIILREENQRLNGTGGCNTFNGSYEVGQMNRIKFSKVATTQMACMNMEIESQLYKVLESIDNYTISTDGKFLSLNKARMAPLARFEVVYLK